MNFEQMDVRTLEEIVNKKAVAIDVFGNWIACTFSGGICGNGSLAADVVVKFRRW